MKLSVEISTFNRKDSLCSVLQRLRAQTYPFDLFEVVVSDDGSSDGTAEMIESIRPDIPFPLRFLTHDHRGCGSTHNRGVSEAKGDIVLMIADDILPVPEMLEEHMKYHDEFPDPSVAVIGRLKQSPELPQTVFQKSWSSVIDDFFPEHKKELTYTDFWVSNVSFKREFMLKNGMFRDLPAGSHEDIELGYRLQQKGMKFIFNPKALGYHHHPETLKSISARAYMHGYNWHNFESSVPERWIRIKAGKAELSDGIFLYLKTKLKAVLHFIFLNRFTNDHLTIPVIKKAEEFPALRFLAPFLIRKVASYNFVRGLRDHERKEGNK
jgi:glycosyltransferase involved in cell wall biosynthesis